MTVTGTDPGRFAITGVGAVSASGIGVAALVAACRRGTSAIAPDRELGVLTGRIADADLARMAVELAASGFAARLFPGEAAPSDLVAQKPWIMTAHTLMQALGPYGELGDDTGVIFATTTAHMRNWEGALPRYVGGELSAAAFAPAFSEYHLSRSLDGLLRAGGFTGPLQVLTSACAAGAQALVLAHAWLKTGKVRRCLVGATESLTKLTVRGFGSFALLSPEIAAPFAADRAGINLSEGAAWLCLEAAPQGPVLAYLRGGATTLDSFDMTRPHPEGRGLYHAMQRALSAAEVEPAAVDWLYAHGTGTQANDAAESAAIHALFGAAAPLVSSTKAVHGHALAASGLIEIVAALGAMADDVVPPTANVDAVDPSLRVNLATRPVQKPLRTVLKTTLGFGGVNAAVVLSKTPPARSDRRRGAVAASAGPVVAGAGTATLAAAAPLLEQADFRKATISMAMAHLAVEQALQTIPAAHRDGMADWGLVVGVGHGELEVTKEFLVTLAVRGIARPFLFQNALHNAVLGFLSLRYGCQGPGATTSTHHFAGEDALDLGADLIRSGACRFCLVVGVEATPTDMLPVVQELLGAAATPGAGAGAIILAAAGLGLAGPTLGAVQCMRAPRAPGAVAADAVLRGYHGADAVRHLAAAVLIGKRGEIRLGKPDGAAARLSLE